MYASVIHNHKKSANVLKTVLTTVPATVPAAPQGRAQNRTWSFLAIPLLPACLGGKCAS